MLRIRSLKLIRLLAALAALVVLASGLSSQPGMGSVQAAGSPPFVDQGGGPVDFGELDRMTDEQRQAIQAKLDGTIAQLSAAGKLAPASAAGQLFDWPIRPAANQSDFGQHMLAQFVDQNPAFPNQVRDYNCQARSYDTSDGYNHSGTDFALWPFAWNKMDANGVQVVAAASGTIVGKADGNFDRSCGFNSNTPNALYIRHADGSTAWYLHMKNGSLTAKGVGDSVVTGEYLGIVGSSGLSTAPHLHFEVRTAQNTLIDPYQGACNSLNPDSWWLNQRPYYDSAINKISTGTAVPQLASCPNPDPSSEAIAFAPNSRIYFTSYYRDQLNSQVGIHRIYRPDGQLYAGWQHSSTRAHDAASLWYWSFNMPATPLGRWLYEITFNGRTYQRAFYLGNPPGAFVMNVPLIRR